MSLARGDVLISISSLQFERAASPRHRSSPLEADGCVQSAAVNPVVTAVFSSPTHTMSKAPRDAIKLLAGLGVEGDAHMGATVKHRSRVAADPTQPNLRQVHLIPSELHAELEVKGFSVAAGQMGENITTAGIDLLGLSVGTLLHLGNDAVLEVTGLRNPCLQAWTQRIPIMRTSRA